MRIGCNKISLKSPLWLTRHPIRFQSIQSNGRATQNPSTKVCFSLVVFCFCPFFPPLAIFFLHVYVIACLHRPQVFSAISFVFFCPDTILSCVLCMHVKHLSTMYPRSTLTDANIHAGIHSDSSHRIVACKRRQVWNIFFNNEYFFDNFFPITRPFYWLRPQFLSRESSFCPQQLSNSLQFIVPPDLHTHMICFSTHGCRKTRVACTKQPRTWFLSTRSLCRFPFPYVSYVFEGFSPSFFCWQFKHQLKTIYFLQYIIFWSNVQNESFGLWQTIRCQLGKKDHQERCLSLWWGIGGLFWSLWEILWFKKVEFFSLIGAIIFYGGRACHIPKILSQVLRFQCSNVQWTKDQQYFMCNYPPSPHCLYPLLSEHHMFLTICLKVAFLAPWIFSNSISREGRDVLILCLQWSQPTKKSIKVHDA